MVILLNMVMRRVNGIELTRVEVEDDLNKVDLRHLGVNDFSSKRKKKSFYNFGLKILVFTIMAQNLWFFTVLAQNISIFTILTEIF